MEQLSDTAIEPTQESSDEFAKPTVEKVCNLL